MRTIATIAIILLCGCPATDEQISRALTGAGYTDIHETGTVIWGCGKDEVGSKFTARNPAGRTVSGIVCCGFFDIKGCTIRF